MHKGVERAGCARGYVYSPSHFIFLSNRVLRCSHNTPQAKRTCFLLIWFTMWALRYLNRLLFQTKVFLGKANIFRVLDKFYQQNGTWFHCAPRAYACHFFHMNNQLWNLFGNWTKYLNRTSHEYNSGYRAGLIFTWDAQNLIFSKWFECIWTHQFIIKFLHCRGPNVACL